MIVLPVNMVDFRLERPLMIHELERLNGPGRADALLALEADLYHPEIRALAPWEALRQIRRLPSSENAYALFLARISALYRYKEIGLTAPRLFLSHRFTAGRSYMHYAGIPIGGDGVTKRGWTSRHFSFLVPDSVVAGGWDLQGHPATPAGAILTIRSISASADESSCRADALHGKAESAGDARGERRLPLRPGWQRVRLDPADAGKRLCVTVSPGVWAEEEHDTLGVRLTELFGRKPGEARPFREVRREDVLFRSMTDSEYRISFEHRILKFDRAGMEYLNALEMAKKTWALRSFDPEIPALAAFARWKDATLAAGVNVLVVEAPENPISRNWLEGSEWARGFSRFLSAEAPSAVQPALSKADALKDRKRRGHLSYADEIHLLPMQKFSDYHHLTFFGAETFSERLAVRLRSLSESL